MALGARAIPWLVPLAVGCGRIGFDARDSGVAPWLSGWGFRQTLVIDHGKVAGDLADFPVLVAITDPDVAAHAKADGSDLVFMDASNQPLAYELERFSPATSSLVAWVKVPALSATADTTLALYYGNASAPAQAQPSAVWSNAFVGVYHFGDGVTVDVRDSTGANNATNNGASETTDAMIGGAVAFSNGPNVAAPTTGLDTTPSALNTVTFWVKYQGAFGKGPAAFVNGGNVYDFWFSSDGCEGFNTQGGEVLGTTQTGLADRWVYVAGVFYNGLPDPQFNQIYIDGVQQTLSLCAAGTPQSRTVGTELDWGGNPGYQIAGMLDEGRLARTARTAAWIGTEYANQHDPAAFVTVGSEQAAP